MRLGSYWINLKEILWARYKPSCSDLTGGFVELGFPGSTLTIYKNQDSYQGAKDVVKYLMNRRAIQATDLNLNPQRQ